jgi:hypothetical protein
MKKNILLILPLISSTALLCMEHPLAQTIMNFTPVVKTESLGLLRSISDFTQDREANNLYHDLENKIYEPYQLEYIDKLHRTLNHFVSTKDARLTDITDLCRDNYKGQIDIRKETALTVHTCLTDQRKENIEDLKKTLEKNDKDFLDEQVKIIAALKESIAQQITLMTKNLEAHKANRNNILKEEGDKIRKNKKATLVLHKLSPSLTIPTDGYCSDDENRQNPDKLGTFYSDQDLLIKMGINDSTYTTANDTDTTITELRKIYSSLQSIEPLRYKPQDAKK